MACLAFLEVLLLSFGMFCFCCSAGRFCFCAFFPPLIFTQYTHNSVFHDYSNILTKSISIFTDVSADLYNGNPSLYYLHFKLILLHRNINLFQSVPPGLLCHLALFPSYTSIIPKNRINCFFTAMV